MPAHLSVKHVVGLLVLLVACSDRSSPGPTGENTTRVLLTDDPFPFDRVERVDLYVVSVSGSLTADTSAAGSFVTMATPNRTIDLLALQNGVTDELGFHAVEDRHYVTDIHATVLHQLGLDSRRLEVPGRKRLELDHGQVIQPILA